MNDAESALRTFGEVIAACVRARLVARAMDGHAVRVSVSTAEFEASHWADHWQFLRWVRGVGEEIAQVQGHRLDTAAKVVDTLLRLAAEWESSQ